jgi:hypothetical protein
MSFAVILMLRRSRCGPVALARGTTKIPTEQLGRRILKKMTVTRASRWSHNGPVQTTRLATQTEMTTSFLRKKHEQQGRRRCDAEDETNRSKAGGFAKAAGGDSGRDAERGAVRHMVDARRAGEVDALPAGEHFRAVAAYAKAAVRGVRGGEALQNGEQGHARGGLWHCVGILGASASARTGSQSEESSPQGAADAASGELLKRLVFAGVVQSE